MTEGLKRILRWAVPLLGALLVFQSVASADPYELQLTGTQHGWTMGGVFTSPYEITIGGGKVVGLNLLACDDFTTDIGFGWDWYANKYSLDDVTDAGPQKFRVTSGSSITVQGPQTSPGVQTTWNVSAEQAYYAAGWLAQELLYDSTVTASATLTGEYSYAIWQIFYSNAYKGWNGAYSSEMSQYWQSIDNLMDAAFAAATAPIQVPLQYTLDIYTPCGVKSDLGCHNPPNLGASQEFLGMTQSTPGSGTNGGVPDGSSLATLAFDLTALFGAIFFIRKRGARNRA